MMSPELSKEGKALTPMAAPNALKELINARGQIITWLSAWSKNAPAIVAILLPSEIFHLSRLMLCPDILVNSRNSLLGRPTEGEGSGNISEMTTSYLFII